MAKQTFYFSHDYNARNDEKIKILIRRHGMIGYGIYWSIVEDLYNNANALRTDYEGIAFDLRTQCDIVASVVQDFDLFQISGNFFGSESVKRRLDERNFKSVKARESASYRWSNANALRPESDRNAIKERKVKESKGNVLTKDSPKEKEKINKKEKEKVEIFRELKPRFPIPKDFGHYFLPKFGVVVFEDETCQPLDEREIKLLTSGQMNSWHFKKDFLVARPLSEVESEHHNRTRRTETAQISPQNEK